MLRRAAWVASLGLLFFGCQETVARFVFEAVIVDGDGGNPVADTDATTVRIGLREGDLPVQREEFPIVDGTFDARFDFQAFTSPTRVRVEMDGPTTALLTAPPQFLPSNTRGFMRVVTAAPSSCETVTFTAMQAPRLSFGMTQSGTFALLIGGTSSADDQLEFLDVLEWEARLFLDEDISLAPLGPTRSASIGEGKILVVPETTAPFVFDMLNASRRVTQLVLHDGAGPRSGLVSVPGVGAMLLGGEVAGEPQSAVSLVDTDAQVTLLELSTPRALPSAAALGQTVLVAGGDDEGTAELLLEGESVGTPIDGVADGVRSSALLVGDGESRALWMGGVGSNDEIRSDTLRFDGCPEACTASSGPMWTEARLEAAQPVPSALIVGGADSRLVEEVRWSGEDVSFEAVLELQSPRGGAGAIVLESGAFIVAGGQDGSAIRDDFEFCVPAALTPL